MRSPETVPLKSSALSSPFSVNLMAAPFTVPVMVRRPMVPDTAAPSVFIVNR